MPNSIRQLTKNPPVDQPLSYKGPINCGLPKAKCISNADFSYDLIYVKHLREGLEAIVKTLDDVYGEYLEYLGEDCAWYDTKCKKERKRLAPHELP